MLLGRWHTQFSGLRHIICTSSCEALRQILALHTTSKKTYRSLYHDWSPWLADHYFSSRPENEHAVFVLGVGTAKRRIRKSEGSGASARLSEWYEWVLFLVMIADEDEQGVFRRLATGVVYPDVWVKTQPEWKTVVLGLLGLLPPTNHLSAPRTCSVESFAVEICFWGSLQSLFRPLWLEKKYTVAYCQSQTLPVDGK